MLQPENSLVHLRQLSNVERASVASLERRTRSTSATMSADDYQRRLAVETESLLSNGEESQRRQRNGGYGTGSWWLSYARGASGLNKVYLLLVFVLLGIAAELFSWHPVALTLFNLIGIIPLSALVSYAADELSNFVGELLGGLINATFGNAVELVVRIQLL
jgi:hypothetical protein